MLDKLQNVSSLLVAVILRPQILLLQSLHDDILESPGAGALAAIDAAAKELEAATPEARRILLDTRHPHDQVGEAFAVVLLVVVELELGLLRAGQRSPSDHGSGIC